MRSQTVSSLAVAVVLTAAAVSHADVLDMPVGKTSLEFVGVGNSGNTPDTRTMNDGTTGYGSVGYGYSIGRCEVTAGQYVEFLNAVARTDTYGLYNARMSDPVNDVGCNIQRSGVSGGYTYTVTGDYANRAVNYVSYGDAMRFANWLTNGQPTGAQDSTTTENGSYVLAGAMTNAELLAIVRRADARYVIPTEDEWYKAAYHKNDGAAGDYWRFPTQSNAAPVKEPPPGHGEPPGSANYKLALGDPYYLSEVGAYTDSPSGYGTFDQGGSMWEWNEGVVPISDYFGRGTRGGSWLSNNSIYLAADSRYAFSPTQEYNFIGFRVAVVPEPATISILAVGGLGLAFRVRRRR